MTRRNFLIVEDEVSLPFALTAYLMERYSPERLQQLIFESFSYLQDHPLYKGGLAQLCDCEVFNMSSFIEDEFDGKLHEYDPVKRMTYSLKAIKFEDDELRITIAPSYSEAVAAMSQETFDGAICDIGIEAGDSTPLDIEEIVKDVDNQNMQRYHNEISGYEFPIGFVRFPEEPDKGLVRTLEELQVQKEKSKNGHYGVLIAKKLSDKGIPVVMNTADIPHGSAGFYLGVGLGLFDGKKLAEDIGKFSSDSYQNAYDEFNRNRLSLGQVLSYPSHVSLEIVRRWTNKGKTIKRYMTSADSIRESIERVKHVLGLERKFNKYKVLCRDEKVPLVVGAKERDTTYETVELPVRTLLKRLEQDS